MKKVFSLLACLLCLGLASCDKGEDDTQPVVPPAEKQVEIVINFGPIPTDFQHDGGISVYGIGIFKNDASSQIVQLVYSYPTTKSTLLGDSYNKYLGQTVYVLVGVTRTLQGCAVSDHSCFWDTMIYVKIEQLKEKNSVYVEFPADREEMIIGKP